MRNLHHYFLGFSLLIATLAFGQPTTPVHKARLHMRFEAAILGDLQLRIKPALTEPSARFDGYQTFSGLPSPNLNAYLAGGDFEGLAAGVLAFENGFQLVLNDRTFNLSPFVLSVGDSPQNLQLKDIEERSWFHLTRPHLYIDGPKGQARLSKVDVSIGPELAAQLNRPELEGVYLAGAELELDFDGPIPSPPRGDCAGVFEGRVDVELFAIGPVGQLAREAGGRVAIAPSADLRNVGKADVPWYRSIAPDGNVSPENIGQHPYLVMHFYRIADGRIQLLGQSDVKHAFYATNVGCPCPGGQILYSGCLDSYAAFTNANRLFLGPRDEVSAFHGTWQSEGSHFDGEPVDDFRDHYPEDHDAFEHRLVVQESDLQDENAVYLVEAWYLVKDDADIYNNIGYRQVEPNLVGSFWSFPFEDSGLTHGPAIDAWQPPGATGDTGVNNGLNTGQGRLKLASRVTALEDGFFRYDYALMNLDFDPGIEVLSVPVPTGVSVRAASFTDADQESGDNWTTTLENDHLIWRAPSGNTLPWGTMFTFSFESDGMPTDMGIELSSPMSGVQEIYMVGGKAPRTICFTQQQWWDTFPSWPEGRRLTDIIQAFNLVCSEGESKTVPR